MSPTKAIGAVDAHGGRRQSWKCNPYDDLLPPDSVTEYLSDTHRQRQSDSIADSIESFYQTGKMDSELAMTIADLGAEKIAPSLSDNDVDFIMANFNFDQMAAEMKKMRETEIAAQSAVHQRLRGGQANSNSRTSKRFF